MGDYYNSYRIFKKAIKITYYTVFELIVNSNKIVR